MIPARCRLPLLLLLGGVVILCLGHQVVIPLVLSPMPPSALPAAETTSSAIAQATTGQGQTGLAATPSAGLMGATAMQTPAQPIVLTVVYDNRTQDPSLRAAWGFACLVETPSVTLLFDTGGDGPTLLYNMTGLGIDPEAIEIVILSHNHGDHTGGLAALLGMRTDLVVYVPRSFAGEIERQVSGRATVIAVSEPVAITEGIMTLGEMGTSIVEQSLAIQARQGLAVVTGCAHPGIVQIAQAARSQGPIALLLGGFHLSEAPLSQIEEIISNLQALGVQQVGPAHCTGDQAIERFRLAFGENFIAVGVGTRIALDA